MRAKEGGAHATHSKFQKNNRPHGGLLQLSRHLVNATSKVEPGRLLCIM